MSMREGLGLAAIEGKRWFRYSDLETATGLTRKTLQQYVSDKRMPLPDEPGIWDASRTDIRDWITGKSRLGRGYRSDLHTDK